MWWEPARFRSPTPHSAVGSCSESHRPLDWPPGGARHHRVSRKRVVRLSRSSVRTSQGTRVAPLIISGGRRRIARPRDSARCSWSAPPRWRQHVSRLGRDPESRRTGWCRKRCEVRLTVPTPRPAGRRLAVLAKDVVHAVFSERMSRYGNHNITTAVWSRFDRVGHYRGRVARRTRSDRSRGDVTSY